MPDNDTELETKARNLVGEMTRPQGIKMLEVLLERSTEDEIVEAIKTAKLDRELDSISGKLLRSSGF